MIEPTDEETLYEYLQRCWNIFDNSSAKALIGSDHDMQILMQQGWEKIYLRHQIYLLRNELEEMRKCCQSDYSPSCSSALSE